MFKKAISIFALVASSAGFTPAFALKNDEARLRQKTAEWDAVRTPEQKISLQKVIAGLKSFRTQADAQTEKCVDSSQVTLAGRYAISFDEKKQPCRIYDLSFPTLKTVFGGTSALKIPAQKLKAKDYLNWLEGRYEDVYQDVQKMNQASTQEIMQQSWINQVQFRNNLQSMKNSDGVIATFHASDLELGQNFKFTAEQRDSLRALLADAKSTGAFTTDEEAQWSALVDRPEKMLENIRFDWNELDKVYEIFLEADFMPIGGPVALVDYRVQYKFAVEKLIRTVMVTALRGLVRLVPQKMTSNILEIAVTDVFEFVEMMYSYQMNRLEATLKSIEQSGAAEVGFEVMHVQKGLNILFGQRSDLFTTYIMSMVQGQKFDWAAIDKIGRSARYAAEKRREVLMDQNFSRLALKNKCSMKIQSTYFATCAKNNEIVTMYSLISDFPLLMWNLGAPPIHFYQAPMAIPLMRGTAWMLSMGARVYDFPMNRSLSNILKDFSRWGLMDEAFLRNQIDTNRTAGVLSAEDSALSRWLYIQNINPFLPKSYEAENSVIQKNLRGLQ